MSTYGSRYLACRRAGLRLSWVTTTELDAEAGGIRCFGDPSFEGIIYRVFVKVIGSCLAPLYNTSNSTSPTTPHLPQLHISHNSTSPTTPHLHQLHIPTNSTLLSQIGFIIIIIPTIIIHIIIIIIVVVIIIILFFFDYFYFLFFNHYYYYFCYYFHPPRQGAREWPPPHVLPRVPRQILSRSQVPHPLRHKQASNFRCYNSIVIFLFQIFFFLNLNF